MIVVLLILVTMRRPGTLAAGSPAYPTTARGDVVDDYFGTRVPDPYRWLEDAASPATVAWVRSQNTFASPYLAGLPGRAAIARRLEAQSSFSRTEIPWEAGGRLFYVEDDGLRQQPAFFAQTGLRGAGRVVLDPDRMSPDGTTAFRAFSPSPWACSIRA